MFLAANTDGDLETWQENLQQFFSSTVLNVIVWGITILFTILVIAQGIKIAMAKTPDEKTACKSRLIQLVIGLAICLGASVIVSVLGAVFTNLWNQN